MMALVNDFGDITVTHHPASDWYYVTSKAKDDYGIPLLEVRVDRALVDGKDKREEMAVAIHAALVACYPPEQT